MAALAAVLAALHLGYPPDVDQGLLVAMGREMAEGAQICRAFWDMKQPGIDWWYQVAGTVFGHDALWYRLAPPRPPPPST